MQNQINHQEVINSHLVVIKNNKEEINILTNLNKCLLEKTKQINVKTINEKVAYYKTLLEINGNNNRIEYLKSEILARERFIDMRKIHVKRNKT